MKKHIFAWLVILLLAMPIVKCAEKVMTYDTTTGKQKATIGNFTQLEAVLGSISDDETDPVASAVEGILKSDGTTLSAASAGVDYVAAETDPIAGALTGIVVGNGSGLTAITDSHANWDSAYGWGNHAEAGYGDASYEFDTNDFNGTGNFATTGTISGVNSTWTGKADYEFGANNFNGTGNITTTGTGIFGRLDASNQSYVYASISGSQVIPNDSWTKISLNATDIDTRGEFDNATNYRFSPQNDGIYIILAVGGFETIGADKLYGIDVRTNGNQTQPYLAYTTSAQSRGFLEYIGIRYLTVANYLELWMYQEGGGNGETTTSPLQPSLFIYELP